MVRGKSVEKDLEMFTKGISFDINDSIPGGGFSTKKGMESWNSMGYSGTLKKSCAVHSQGRVPNLLSLKRMTMIAVKSLKVDFLSI